MSLDLQQSLIATGITMIQANFATILMTLLEMIQREGIEILLRLNLFQKY